MPGTASTHHSDRARPRPTPVTRTAGSKAPVLFRLPTIELAAIAEEDLADAGLSDPPAQSLGGKTFGPQDAPVSSSTTLATPPAPRSSIATQFATATPIQSRVLETEPLSSSSATVSSALGQTEFLNPTESRTAAIEHPVTAIPTETAPRAAEPQLAGRRSWWEHWSSGIVLILLVMVLVAASILAFSDSKTGTSTQTAAGSSSDDDFDLANIQIPNIEIGQPSLSNSETQDNQAWVSADSPRGSNLSPADEQAEFPNAASDGLILGDLEMSALRPTMPFAPSGTTPTNTSLGFSANATQNNAVPTATLATPQGVQTPPLFDSRSNAVPDQSVSPTTPALTASSGSLPVNPAGSSPSFYDGAAALRPEQQLSNTPAVQPEASGLLPTQMPNLQATVNVAPTGSVLISHQTPSVPDPSALQSPLPFAQPQIASPTDVPAMSSPSINQGAIDSQQQPLPPLSFQQPAASTVPSSQPQLQPPSLTSQTASASSQANQFSTQQTATPASPGIVQSATPEMDADAYIRAYQQFRELNQAQNGPASNRFSPDSTRQNENGFMLGSPPPATGYPQN